MLVEAIWSIIPRRHVGAGAEISLGSDLVVGSEVSTNGDLMRIDGVVVDVGSIGSHTTDPTSNLVKVTIPAISDRYAIRPN